MKRTRLNAVSPRHVGPVGLRRSAHSTKPPTVAEQARIAAIVEIGCLACRINAVLGFHLTRMNVEVHHLLSGGRRIGHMATLGLCHYHHQGKRLPLIDRGYNAQRELYGPSLEKDSKGFHALYGTDEELLNFQNQALALWSAGKKAAMAGATICRH